MLLKKSFEFRQIFQRRGQTFLQLFFLLNKEHSVKFRAFFFILYPDREIKPYGRRIFPGIVIGPLVTTNRVTGHPAVQIHHIRDAFLRFVPSLTVAPRRIVQMRPQVRILRTIPLPTAGINHRLGLVQSDPIFQWFRGSSSAPRLNQTIHGNLEPVGNGVEKSRGKVGQ